MTHTLHRFGSYERVENDFIVTMMSAKGLNDDHAVQKEKKFLETALKYGPVNIGNASKGGQYQASKDLHPTAHWRRDASPHPDTVVAGLDSPSVVSAVFDNFEAVQKFVAELVELDLGLSVNISSVPDKAVECCRACGIARHSVEYSLGFQGRTDKLPDDMTLELSTMCGHGMVSFALARKMIDWVRTNRRTPEQASRYMARFCVCGIHNPARAREILERAAEGKS